MKALIDANILVRLASPGDPQRDDALAALQLLVDGGDEVCVVPQAIYEYWVVATRPKHDNGLGLPIEMASADVHRIISEFLLLSDSAELFSTWLALVGQHQVKGKVAHDARLVAAMTHHGISHLLTFNGQDFARFSEITVILPKPIAGSPSATSD